MTVKEFWESEKPLAILCNTRDKAKRLLIRFYELGKTWTSDESYLETDNYYCWGNLTCYVNDGTYCGIDYAERYSIQIIKFDDLEDFKGQQTITKQNVMLYLKAIVAREDSQYAQDTLEYFENLIEITDIIKKHLTISKVAIHYVNNAIEPKELKGTAIEENNKVKEWLENDK